MAYNLVLSALNCRQIIMFPRLLSPSLTIKSYHYWVAFLIGVCSCIVTSYAIAAMPLPHGFILGSDRTCGLHKAYFYACCGIGVIVFTVLIYSLFKYRQSKGTRAVHFHTHIGAEIFWIVLPFLILIALVAPAMIVLQQTCG